MIVQVIRHNREIVLRSYTMFHRSYDVYETVAYFNQNFLNINFYFNMYNIFGTLGIGVKYI